MPFLKKPIWKKYENRLNNIKEIIGQQNREILDEEIPFQLAKEVCEKSNLIFYLYFESNPHVLTSWKKGTDEKFEILSPLDILVRYGGGLIEETLEKGYSEIKKTVNS